MTDGTARVQRDNYRVSLFYDLAKTAVLRLAFAQGARARAARLHRGGADARLAALGDDARGLRRDRGELARRRRPPAALRAISESPRYVGRAVAALAADPDVARRNGGSFSSGGLAQEYGFTDVDG